MNDEDVLRSTWSTTIMRGSLRQSKTPIFPVADDIFPFSQYCMKPYGKKNLTDEEILFN